MEFGSDQCNKEGCKGCHKCEDFSPIYETVEERVNGISDEQLIDELDRRKKARKNKELIEAYNAPILEKIEELETSIVELT